MDRFIYQKNKNKNNIKILSKCIDKGKWTTAPWTLCSSSVEWVDRLLMADQILAPPWFFQCGLHPAAQAPAGLCPHPWKEVSFPSPGAESVAFPLCSPTKPAITSVRRKVQWHLNPHMRKPKQFPSAWEVVLKALIPIQETSESCTQLMHMLAHTHTNIHKHEWKSKLFFPE